MKRALNRLAAFLIPVALLAGVCYLLWPHSFADLQPECDSITLIRTDTTEDCIHRPAGGRLGMSDGAVPGLHEI